MSLQSIKKTHQNQITAMESLGASRFSVLKEQAGYSMVEVGFVLLMIALAMIGLLAYFTSNSTTATAQQMVGDLTSLIGKVKSAYSNNYSAVANAGLDTGGFFSGLPSFKDTGGVVTHNLGGGTLVVSSGTVTTAGDSVSYVISGLPDAACLPLASSLARGVTKLSLGTNVVKAAGGQPDPSKIICSGGSNTMTILVM